MKRAILIIVMILIISCGQGKEHRNLATVEIEPFELTVTKFDFSMAYGIAYRITHKDLHIIFRGELEGEKDTTLFESLLKKSESLKNMSNIEFGKLKDRYFNPCIADGSQINVHFQKGKTKKSVYLSNYYQEDIGEIVDFVNQIVPNKYQIDYDKKWLEKRLKECILIE